MTDKTLAQLIYDYSACGSPIADLLRELEQARSRLEAQEETIRRYREALLPLTLKHYADYQDRIRAALTGSET